MALKYPKKPRAKKYRRKPKASASSATQESWLKHVAEVDRDNRKKLSEWTKAKSAIDSEKKKKATLAKRIAGVKAKK